MTILWRLRLALIAATLITPARGQKPVFAWSGRVGADVVTGVAAAPDGSIVVVGRTAGNSSDQPDVFIGGIAPDGASTPCSMTIASPGAELTDAMALVPDGTVVVSGTAGSPNFPRQPAMPPGAGQDADRFLFRADPCTQALRYSVYLPAGIAPLAMVAAKDGSVSIGAALSGEPDRGVLLHFGPDGALQERVALRGIPLVLAVDGAGAVYATGWVSSAGQRRAFLAKYPSPFKQPAFDVTFGDGASTVGTAIAVDDAGQVLLGACGAAPDSRYSTLGDPCNYSAARVVRFFADGSLDFSRLVDEAVTLSEAEWRRPVGVGFGPDGRFWVAIAGTVGFPLGSPEPAWLNGVVLRSFAADGAPAGGETLIPGLRLGSPLPAAGFGAGGRIAVAMLPTLLPATAGAVDSGAARAVSVLAFDLAGAGDAAFVMTDRETLTLDEARVSGTNLRIRDPKTVHLRSSDAAERPYAAAIVWAANRGVPARPLDFETDNTAGTLPAAMQIRLATELTGERGTLVVLAPGTQGTTVIPLQSRFPFLSVLLEPVETLELPQPSLATIPVRVRVTDRNSIELRLPFRLSHSIPWLRFETQEGTTPAEVNAVVDARALAQGSHQGQVAVTLEDAVANVGFGVGVGPSFRLFVQPSGNLSVPIGSLYTHTIRLTSTGDPMDFTLESRTSWVTVSPATGRTPAEVTVTVDPAGLRSVGETVNAFLVIRSGAYSQFPTLFYHLVPATVTYFPDRALESGAPGSLITIEAGTSRCEAAAVEGPPWPLTLGSCALRINGNPVPIRSIVAGTRNAPQFNLAPIYTIVAQLPYDVEGPSVTAEIEDRNGDRRTFSIPIKPAVPVSQSLVGGGPQTAVVRKPGEEVVARVSGLGKTDDPAPLGDVPDHAIHPLVRVDPFVGGRAAKLLSVELSRTEPGVFEVRFEVPDLAPDLYLVTLRVNGQNVVVGGVRIPE